MLNIKVYIYIYIALCDILIITRIIIRMHPKFVSIFHLSYFIENKPCDPNNVFSLSIILIFHLFISQFLNK